MMRKKTPAAQLDRDIAGAVGKKARLSIRPKTYRDVPGYSITGRDSYGRKISIHTRTREGAETICRLYRERLDPFDVVNAVLRRGG